MPREDDIEAEDNMLRGVWERMSKEHDPEPDDDTLAGGDTPQEPEVQAQPGTERDASGRFAKKAEAAPEAPQGEQKTAEGGAPPEAAKPLSDPAQKPADGNAGPAPADDEITRKLPRAVAAVWKDIPEAARTAILADRQALANRIGEAGREAAPFRRVQEKLHQEFPETRGWTPEQLSDRLTTIARFEQSLSADPARTLLITARGLGVLPQLRQVLGGAAASEAEQVLPKLVEEIRVLREQLAQQPALAEQRMREVAVSEQVEDTLSRFKRDCGDEWDMVEKSGLLPGAITRAIERNPDKPRGDILAEAFEEVAWSVPETRQRRIDAQVQASASAATSPRTEASRRALGARIPNRGAEGASVQPRNLDAALRAKYRELTQT